MTSPQSWHQNTRTITYNETVFRHLDDERDKRMQMRLRPYQAAHMGFTITVIPPRLERNVTNLCFDPTESVVVSAVSRTTRTDFVIVE
jgi:hypothetical protein